MGFTNYLPFVQSPQDNKVARPIQPETDGGKKLSKLMKKVSMAVGLGSTSIFSARSEFEPPPFDLNRISKAIDTDSYVKQGFNKWKELIWKEGWEIVGENQEAVEYLYQRLNYMELAMGQPIQQFFEELADQLVKYANCFVRKARADLNPVFPTQLKGLQGKSGEERLPIIGYEILPTEQIKIKRDRHNNSRRYMQDASLSGISSLGGAFSSTSVPTTQPSWSSDDVIHFFADKKPGHAFGTPFMDASIEDIVSIRQIEEDLLNLIHQELFPLYSVKVGTDEYPGDDDEIIQAAQEISDMRTEGALVHSERREIKVLGGEGNALEIDPYLKHFKERVAVGLGIFPHHLGMSAESGNRSMTDRLDISLYDKIKNFQRYISEAMRIFVLNELLFEGGFNPIKNANGKNVDRCHFKFREIDVETQIKKENQAIQKFVTNVATLEETRLALGMSPDVDEADLFLALQARMMPDTIASGGSTATGKPSAPKKVDTTPAPAVKPAPSTGGKPNMPSKAKSQMANKTRPQNQHGTRSAPKVRHDDSDDVLWIYEEVLDILDKDNPNDEICD